MVQGYTWRDMPPGLRKFARGDVFVHAGEPATTVFVLKRGHARTFLLSEDGQDTTTSILCAPQVVSISPLLSRPTYDAFAEALEPVEAWAWPADRLSRLLLVDRELSGLVVGALSQRLAQAVALLGNVALVDVTERLHDVQLRLSDRANARVAITHRTLAQLIGARPETVSRSLHRRPAWASPVAAPEEPTTCTCATRDVAASSSSFAAGQRILPPEPHAPCVFLVHAGAVRLFLEDGRGRQVSVDRVEAGEYFGLPALAAASAPSLASEALGDVQLSTFDAGALLRLLDRQPELAQTLMTQVAARIERVERRLRRAHGANACTRLASLLDDLAEQEGELQADGYRLLPSGWTHVALGREVGLCRETVTRALRALAVAGRVRQRRRRLLVRPIRAEL